MQIKLHNWHTIEAISDKRILTLEDLLQATNMNPELWEILNVVNNKRDCSSTNRKDWKITTVENHQIKATMKPLSQLVKPDIMAKLKEILDSNIRPLVKVPEKEWEVLANINHFDLHINRYANNTKKYLKEINDKTMRLFELLLRDNPAKLLYINGGDYFNSDIKSRTTKGTDQLNSLKEQEAFGIGLQHQRDLIATFASELPVDVMYVSGNHDMYSTNYLGQAIDLAFSKTEGVNVDSTDKPIKRMNRGNNTIATMHGDMIKDNQILPNLVTEGNTKKFIYAMKGDKHVKITKEIGNCLIDTYPSPANNDDWSLRNGWNKKGKIYGNSFDKKEGKIAEYGR